MVNEGKQKEFIERLEKFCKQLDDDGFFTEGSGCQALILASCEEKVHTMCVGTGPALSEMIADFMLDDPNQAMVIEVGREMYRHYVAPKKDSAGGNKSYGGNPVGKPNGELLS